MKIQGKSYQTIWLKEKDATVVETIDQRDLPFRFRVFEMRTAEDAFFAIREMVVRGAPLIGVTAAYGLYLAALELGAEASLELLREKAEYLKQARPTAVNLAAVLDEIILGLDGETKGNQLIALLLQRVESLKMREVEFGSQIGECGLALIENVYRQKGAPVNILTHCNAGWLACIDWGTATAPIYKAHRKRIPVHVWVDETRPRNQGARLTAFELGEEGVPHTVVPDNAGGHLMQHGMVDLVIVGSDRTTVTGDVANKIGTYLKALAAADNKVPFYVALPSTSFDWQMEDGLREIPIEQRSADEVACIEGWDGDDIRQVQLIPKNSSVANYGFDVTPARLVTGLITERGICAANKNAILQLFPEKRSDKLS